MTYQINSGNSEATENLAARIGSRLRGGEILTLQSDLGGGKTTFVRGLAHGMGSSDHVASPTFTISRVYVSESRSLELHHFDFYRLSEPGIIAHELSEVLDDAHAVTVIEWSQIVSGVLPEETITITINRTGDTTRFIQIEYPPAREYLFTEGSS